LDAFRARSRDGGGTRDGGGNTKRERVSARSEQCAGAGRAAEGFDDPRRDA